MKVNENVSLVDYSTMRLGGDAKFLVEVNNRDELLEAIKWARERNEKILPIGEGSNIIFRDEGFDGLVIVNRIMGYEVIDEDKDSKTLKVGSGENWDSVVERAVNDGVSGIESLSLIPGTAGATPVQNVGAYGQEISDTLVEVEIINLGSDEFATISNKECEFGYRSSVFQTSEGKNNIVVSITLKLNKAWPKPPFYDSLQRQLDMMGITNYSLKNIRDAVIAVRNSKLPDPKVIANTGSFFKNPIIKKEDFDILQKKYMNIPGYEASKNTVKVPAGWLLEKAGFKNFKHENGMGMYELHSLVMVNYGATKYAALKELKEMIIAKIQDQFGITLEQEPETI